MSELVVQGDVMLDVPNARRLTDEAKEGSDRLMRLLVELYEGEAHVALGYESWQAYCEAEFGMSGRRALDVLDHGRVVSAIESERESSRADLPNQDVAIRSLARLLPPIASVSPQARKQRNGSDEQVAAAWAKVMEAKAADDDPDTPITASFAKKVLVKAGDLPDTSGAAGKPGWFELLGEVGDTLVRAEKQLTKVEGALTRTPNKTFRAKADLYAEWAAGLAERLREIAKEN